MTLASATAPWVLDHAPYTPFMEARTRDAPGISPLGTAPWLSRDADFAAQTAYRRQLVRARRPEVIAEVPGSEDIVAEWAGMIGIADSTDPLAESASVAAEDFCLLRPGSADGYVLVAATLCFPARWMLAEKIGRPLDPIHEYVPGYAEDLARRVNRMFDTLRPDRPLFRVNWMVDPDPELFQPSSKHATGGLAGGQCTFYLRTERQTLRRMPQTSAVIFGIKTTVSLLSALPHEQIVALAEGMRGYSPGKIAYRGGEDWHHTALAELDRLDRSAAA